MGDPCVIPGPLSRIDASLPPLDEEGMLPVRAPIAPQTIADCFDPLDPLGNLDGALGLCGARSHAA